MNFTMKEGCPVCISKILSFQLVHVSEVSVNSVILNFPVNYNLRLACKQARENHIFVVSSNNEFLIITIVVTEEDWEE